jgi:hypothetical protein
MAKRISKAERDAAECDAQAEKWEAEARSDGARGLETYAHLNEERARDARREASALRAAR